jgi:hypothetical protein
MATIEEMATSGQPIKPTSIKLTFEEKTFLEKAREQSEQLQLELRNKANQMLAEYLEKRQELDEIHALRVEELNQRFSSVPTEEPLPRVSTAVDDEDGFEIVNADEAVETCPQPTNQKGKNTMWTLLFGRSGRKSLDHK